MIFPSRSVELEPPSLPRRLSRHPSATSLRAAVAAAPVITLHLRPDKKLFAPTLLPFAFPLFIVVWLLLSPWLPLPLIKVIIIARFPNGREEEGLQGF